jgi:hypothetical protein
VLTSNVSDKSGGNIPCCGVPHTGHVPPFKVISAPQHVQKAATLFNLHGHYDSLDEPQKYKDSRRTVGIYSRALFGPTNSTSAGWGISDGIDSRVHSGKSFQPQLDDVSFELLRRSELPTAVVHETIRGQVH